MTSFEPKDISTGKLHSYLLSAVAPRPIAFASTLDAEGNLWFASEGIYKYDGESWRLYDSSNSGLFGNYIQAVEPYEGGVWLGTEVGLVDFKNCGDGEPIEFAKEQVSSIDTRSLESQNLHISPNPFSDRISVYSDNAGETILSIYLYDMLGDLQLHWKSSEDDSISKAEVVLSNRMSNGFYLAVISTSDGVFYKKMMRSN